jgi:hypothetical protein
MPFDGEGIAVEDLGKDLRLRNLPRKARIPEVVDERGGALKSRVSDDGRGSDRFGLRERLDELLDAEGVVPVPVRDVDVRQVPVVSLDPIDELQILRCSGTCRPTPRRARRRSESRC